MKYTVDYFLNKFDILEDEDIGTISLEHHCALYWCEVTIDGQGVYKMTPEALKLSKIFGKVFPECYLHDNAEKVYNVNDGLGGFDKYGLTPKARVMYTLNKAKEMGIK